MKPTASSHHEIGNIDRRLAAAVCFFVSFVAICAWIVLTPESALTPLQESHSPGAKVSRDDRKFSSYSELLSEYQKLMLELRAVKSGVDGLRHQLYNEPQPPKTDRYTEMKIEKGRNAPKGPTPVGEDQRFGETIFVSVASFRDWECPNTVRDMYDKAANPRRIILGIIEQNEVGDPSCIPEEYNNEDCESSHEFCPRDNIRIRRVRPHEARGPTFGRWVAMLMFRDEKYFMMIDSHNRFLKNWDTKIINMYHLIPSRKGVISHYPNSWLNKTSDVESEGSLMVMCYAHFLDLGYMRLGARVMPRSARPRLCPYAAAGFLFADGALVREVPFDPYLDFVFDGEEILFSVRMWTHGWDIYSPTESVLFHFYLRSGAPRVWTVKELSWAPVQRISQQRVQYIMGSTYPNSTVRMVPLNQDISPRIDKDLDTYGLGKERTIEEYWRFARVDPIHRKTDYSFCDNIPNQLR